MVDTQQLYQKIGNLPDSLLSQVADYVDFLISRNDISKNDAIPDWQIKETEKRIRQIENDKIELIAWDEAKSEIFKK